jgi:hypothetical protein
MINKQKKLLFAVLWATSKHRTNNIVLWVFFFFVVCFVTDRQMAAASADV